MADGSISFTEYERAISASVACIADVGFTVSGPEFNISAQIFEYSYGVVDVTDNEIERLWIRADNCIATYEDDIGIGWVRQISPEPPTAERFRNSLADCLESELGVTITDRDSDAEIERFLSTPSYTLCLGRLAEILQG